MDWTYELVASVLGEEALKVLLNLGWVEGHGDLRIFEYLNPEEFTLGLTLENQKAIIRLLSRLGLLQKIKGEWRLSRRGVQLFQIALTQTY